MSYSQPNILYIMSDDHASHAMSCYGSRINRIGFWEAGYRRDEGVMISTREGGTLIDYEDEDPEIRRQYEQALKGEGIECQMPPVDSPQAAVRVAIVQEYGDKKARQEDDGL